MVSFRHLFDNGRVIHTASCYGNNDLEVVEKTEEGEAIRLLLVYFKYIVEANSISKYKVISVRLIYVCG